MADDRLSSKTFSRYRDQLTLAHRRWDAEAKPIAERLHAYYRGDQWPNRDPGTPGTGIPPLVINLIFADVKVMLPSLALRHPRVFIKPTAATTRDPQTGEFVQLINGTPVPILKAAQAQEALINWRWRELKLVEQVRRALLDALLSPFGVCKLGYTLTTEKIDAGEELEPHELIRAEAPFALRWTPSAFRVDPDARYPDLSDAGWVAFGSKVRLEDLRRNPRYKNTKNLEGTVSVRTDYRKPLLGGPIGEAPLQEPQDEGLKRVQIWEVWDKRTHKRLVLADDHDRALEYVDWPQAYEHFPAETLYLSETPDTLYGPPDLWHVLWGQDAYNELSAMILSSAKRQLRKYIAQAGAFDEKNLAILTSPIDAAVAEAQGAVNLDQAIKPLDMAQISSDWWTARLTFRDDHDRIAGLGDFIRGVAEKVDTATEASLIQSNLSVRVNDARARVEDFAARLSRQILQIDAQTASLPKMIPVVGPDGVQALGQFLEVADIETLQAETAVEVEIGSMQPINARQRKADIQELFATLNGDPMTDQFELRQRLIPAFTDSIPDVEKVFISREEFAQMAPALQGLGAEAPAAATSLPEPGLDAGLAPPPILGA